MRDSTVSAVAEPCLIPDPIEAPASCLGQLHPGLLDDLGAIAGALLAPETFDAVLALAVGARSASDVLRVWQRLHELVEPTRALNPDRAAQAHVARLAESMPAALAAVLLAEGICARESLAKHFRIYGPPPGYSAIPALLADRWRDALLWLQGKAGAAVTAREK